MSEVHAKQLRYENNENLRDEMREILLEWIGEVW